MYKTLEIIKKFNERISDYAFKHSKNVKGVDRNNNLHFDGEEYEILENGDIEVWENYSDRCGNQEYAWCTISQESAMNLLAEVIAEVQASRKE